MTWLNFGWTVFLVAISIWLLSTIAVAMLFWRARRDTERQIVEMRRRHDETRAEIKRGARPRIRRFRP